MVKDQWVHLRKMILDAMVDSQDPEGAPPNFNTSTLSGVSKICADMATQSINVVMVDLCEGKKYSRGIRCDGIGNKSSYVSSTHQYPTISKWEYPSGGIYTLLDRGKLNSGATLWKGKLTESKSEVNVKPYEHAVAMY